MHVRSPKCFTLKALFQSKFSNIFIRMTRKIKQPHYLHLIKGKGFMMMTLADAHQYALENNADVWNVHESFDLKPEYFDSEAEMEETD